MAGRIEWATVDSQVLAGNLLGDPHVRGLPVYLPPGYDDEPTRRYPVVWMLSGYGGRGSMLLNDNLWTPTIQQQLDALVAGGMGSFIMPLPDCSTRYGGSQYINSTATGRYEDYLSLELVPFVDAHFRTLPGREHRAVIGKSSGGYGALVSAMRHPDLWGAVACHSGDMYFELCYKLDFPKFLNRIARHEHDPRRFWEQLEASVKKSASDLEALNVLAMAACYSPNPLAQGLPIDFPFDLRTGELWPAIWSRWLEHDPVELAPRYVDALRSLRLLYLDCGTRDEYHLHYGARILAQRLQSAGVPFEHQEFDDGHRSTWYRYDVSLPLLAAAIS